MATHGGAASRPSDVSEVSPIDDAGSGAGDTQEFNDFFDNPSDDTGSTGGGGGSKDTGSGGGGGTGGGGSDCVDRAKIIYLVSKENVLLNFNPDTKTIKKIGTLNCPAPFGSTPFSMAVDRQANAYVLYQTGLGSGAGMFKVSTLDASCQKTAYIPNSKGLQVFGMAFSADAPGAVTEQLFVAGGGSGGFFSGPNKLAIIDLKTFQLQPLAKLNPVASGVDLSGNGNGELWGFFTSTKPPSVRQIDKQTATTVSSLPLAGADFAGISSWAFASWGGDFFLFSRNGLQASTVVHRLDQSGNATKVVPALGYTIVGAGVSSCAPTKPAP